MNNEEKNVMTIVTLARVVEATLWYILPPTHGTFSADERQKRYVALTTLTAPGSPFATNCDSNGETGKNLKEEMQYFIEDVYGNSGRKIVSVGLDNVVKVEPSLVVELFSSIVRLRGYLESFLKAALKVLRERNLLESDFEELVNTDIKYFHSFAGKVSCVLLSSKFLEINKMARSLNENYSKTHGGMNPQNDPNFSVENEPSFRMLESEFHQINNDMNAVLNTYGNDPVDSEFKFARDSVYNDCEIFTGKKQTTDIDAYFNIFNSYFDSIIESNQAKLNKMFADIGKKIQADAKVEEAKEETSEVKE